MNAEDQLVSRYNSLKPTAFSILVSLEIREQIFPDSSPVAFTVEVELRSDTEDFRREIKDNHRLLLSFEGVRELKIQQPTSSLFDIGFLKISSIRERQWEDLNYKIQSEDDSISFLCRRFEASLRG